MDDTILNFNYPTDTPKIIKVIGVGGGGGNAVTHMYKEGIHDVTFVLCNTDNQALIVAVADIQQPASLVVPVFNPVIPLFFLYCFRLDRIFLSVRRG